MIDVGQFRDEVIKPSLNLINSYSLNAEELLIATMAHESLGGTYLKQIGMEHGALGVYQMEQRTYVDIWNNYLHKRMQLRTAIFNFCNLANFPQPEEMVTNLKYATMMARVFYLRIPEKLPLYNDIDGIWEYYKTYWNTRHGKAEKADFIANYENYIK